MQNVLKLATEQDAWKLSVLCLIFTLQHHFYVENLLSHQLATHRENVRAIYTLITLSKN
jgi:hypothetical protein